jgi:hypothetical protein
MELVAAWLVGGAGRHYEAAAKDLKQGHRLMGVMIDGK